MSNKQEDSSVSIVFDHIAIRRFIGVIALILPLLVVVAAWDFPDSISASYHTPVGFPYTPYFPSPRDIFVGSLFIIGAFLMSYKGHEHPITPEQVGGIWHKLGTKAVELRQWQHKHEEDIISWIGGISAWMVALFPTAQGTECSDVILFSMGTAPDAIAQTVSIVHLSFAAILFLTTVYFCLVAFKRRLEPKIRRSLLVGSAHSAPLHRRRFLYNLSGWATLILIAAIGLSGVFLKNGLCVIYNQTYWAETVMLVLFGIAWFTASKPPFLREPGAQ